EPLVDASRETRHVEEHVDRDDDQQHDREQRLADGDGGTFDEGNDLVRVLADVALADLPHEPVPAIADLHRLQVVRVQPPLEAVDVAVGGSLSGRTVTIREVVVEPVRCRRRLAGDRGHDAEDHERQRRREAQVHEGDRQAAREPHHLQRPDDRIQEQREERRHEEEEDDVSRGRREHPEEQQQQRQPDELDPARDHHPGRPPDRRHAGDAISRLQGIRPPDWEWSWATDGALALDRHEVREEPSAESRIAVSRSPRLKALGASATVPRMSPPVTNRRARATHRRRLERERRLRRLAVLVALLVVGLVTVLMSAFGGSGARVVAPTPASASRLLPAGPPQPEIVARIGALHLQLPVSKSRVTAIGYQGGAEGALALTPLGTQVNEGILKRLVHTVFGGSSGEPRWYQLPGGQGPGTSSIDVGAPAGTDV